MYRKVADFLVDWKEESEMSVKVFEYLTDQALSQRVTPDGRSLGRLAWHITMTIGEILHKAKLPIESPSDEEQNAEGHSSVQAIVSRYRSEAAKVAELVKAHWTDETLLEKVSMYGDVWSKGVVLSVLIRHQTHHRGQMTVLMRQAGLKVPGVYGPAQEEWAAFGMPAMK